jgi:hypothetical protein
MSDKYPGGLVTAAAPAGYSVFFDGTGDYLTVPSNAALTLGTGNFCLEFWAYPTSFSATRSWLSNRNGTETNRWGIDSNTSGQFYLYGNGGFVVTSTAQTVNQWVHVCVTRAGTGSNQTRIFINGVLSAVGTSSTDFAADVVSIGASPTGSQAAIGNVSNARIIKGSIPTEYTTTSTTVGAQIFSPPTQLFPVTNTSLLTCQSPTIIDTSSNAFTITVLGNTVVSTFTPFPSSYYFYNAPINGNTREMVPANVAGFNPAYGAAAPGVWTLDQAQYFTANRLWPIYDPYFNYTTLMLSGNQPSGVTDTNNNVFKDSSTNNFSITRNGNTTQGTFSPFSQTGWSNNFGSGNYFSAATNADFALSGDFTIEAWVNPTSAYTTYNYVFAVNVNNGLVFYVTGGNLVVRTYNGTDLLSSAIIPALNTWTHVAATRSGTTLRIFVNGVQTASTTNSTSFPQGPALVGNDGSNLAPWLGYISNVRLVKGQALYTGTFTPSTSALTSTSVGSTGSGAASSITGTVSLLTSQSNRFVDNSTTPKALTVTGTPSVQPFSPFAPTAAYSADTVGGSGYFDGTGDFLTAPANNAFGFGTGDFTIEMWLYPISISSLDTGLFYVEQSGGIVCLLSPTSGYFGIGTRNVSYDLTSTIKPTLNAWTHVVFSRVSGTGYIFVNGVLNVSGSLTNNYLTSVSGLSYISGNFSNSGASFNGYISGYRIVKGSGVTSVTVPTAPPTPITNTSLLLNYTNAGIIDATGKNVLETVSTAQISTARSKFGGSSIVFNGTSDSLLFPSTPNLALGTGDFTIEFWVNINALPGSQFAAIYDMRTPNTDNIGFDIMLYFNTFSFGTATTLYIGGTTTPLTNTWYHYALTRSGNTFKQFLNGTQEGTTYTGSSTQNFTNNTLKIANGANGYFNGYLSGIRVTKGYARYTSNFTPPTSALQQQ